MAALEHRAECVSDLAFDEWLSDSIAPAARRTLEAHLAHCVSCALRGDALATQREAFLARVPDWQALQSSVRRPSRRSGLRWLWAASAPLAAAAAWLALTFLRPHAATFGVRSKGGPHIGAFIKRGEHVARAEPGALVQAGDYVRFTYSSDVPVYFALLNRDVRRAATYYPLAAQTVLSRAGQDVALDFSIQLDDAPDSEQMYGLFCDAPQALEPLRVQLQTTQRLAPPPHCRVDVLTLSKGKPGG